MYKHFIGKKWKETNYLYSIENWKETRTEPNSEQIYTFLILSPRKENSDKLCWDTKTKKSLPKGTLIKKNNM